MPTPTVFFLYNCRLDPLPKTAVRGLFNFLKGQLSHNLFSELWALWRKIVVGLRNCREPIECVIYNENDKIYTFALASVASKTWPKIAAAGPVAKNCRSGVI